MRRGVSDGRRRSCLGGERDETGLVRKDADDAARREISSPSSGGSLARSDATDRTTRARGDRREDAPVALCGIFSGFRSGFTNFATSSSASDASDDALPLSHVRYAKPPSITSEVKLGVRDIDRGSGESGGTAVVVVVVVVAVAAAAFLRFVRPGRGFAAPSASAIVGASRDVAGARDPGVPSKRRPVRNVSHFASIRFFSYSYSMAF